ncbi:SagB/ThcOx family dehydrogenase [Tumebacillus flagellatus]|uniref:SagB/ThcOx family dehydrogenase n=1 Tax=Tumebacillus flagellatus TaxID=1157490 RepID=UPI00068D991C|nr:SagB/ThcOx family dehydrogenase [Tumebacillus flagellatus]
MHNVEGLEPGLYHLNVRDWVLEGLKFGDLREFAHTVTHNQQAAGAAAVNFVWTAMTDRQRWKYHERTYRCIFWDVGHVAHGLHLAAHGLGLGSVSMGHWFDDEMNEFLGLDGVDTSRS